MPMPEDAVHSLSKTLLDRDEPVLGANGALPAVQTFCEDMAEGTGKTARVERHTRLFELGDLVEPRPVAGRLRPATLDEQDLVASWYEAFMADADEQAGREPGASPHEAPTDEELGRRIESGRVFVWVDEDDVPVNVTAATAPAYGVSRIGPGLHAQGAAWEGLRECGCVRRLGAAPAERRAAVSVHRPGQPDLEQDLRGDRLPASGGHGESARGVRPP